MKEINRPEAVTAAAQRIGDVARDLAHDVAEGYRRSTRFVRLRVAIVGTWALLSIVTLWAACPSSGPANALGAEARISEELVGTQLLVHNTSGTVWTEVELELDGAWEWRTKWIRPGQKLVIGLDQFTRDGAAAPRDLKPKSLRIDCEQGSATSTLAPR